MSSPDRYGILPLPAPGHRALPPPAIPGRSWHDRPHGPALPAGSSRNYAHHPLFGFVRSRVPAPPARNASHRSVSAHVLVPVTIDGLAPGPPSGSRQYACSILRIAAMSLCERIPHILVQRVVPLQRPSSPATSLPQAPPAYTYSESRCLLPHTSARFPCPYRSVYNMA